jgi:aminoglycoside phosphotransferase (APT) family kinase protein
MNLEIKNYADIESIKTILREKYPLSQNLEIIDHGYDNIVVIVDSMYALRFPRNEIAYKRSLFEKSILNDLKTIESIHIPVVLDENDNPPYLITSFVKGKHLSLSEIDSLDKEYQHKFAKDVANFAYQMHSLLSVDLAVRIRHGLGLDQINEEPWGVYFKKNLIDNKLPTEVKDKFAKDYFGFWKENDSKEDLLVVHDDLHNENMLFQNKKLVGILDFGDTNIGTAEQELRQLYRINQDVVESAAKEYSKLSGKKLNVELIKTWAILQEMAAYHHRLLINETSHPAFKRAVDNLNHWLPEGQW